MTVNNIDAAAEISDVVRYHIAVESDSVSLTVTPDVARELDGMGVKFTALMGMGVSADDVGELIRWQVTTLADRVRLEAAVEGSLLLPPVGFEGTEVGRWELACDPVRRIERDWHRSFLTTDGGGVSVSATVTEWADEAHRVVRGEPTVHVDGEYAELSPDQAREVAAAIVTAADSVTGGIRR
ncbi:hypothetical protein LQL77_06930 [Rhodococcus cerastii]|nr:hypothetical protein [Rhodococcus cerastii]